MKRYFTQDSNVRNTVTWKSVDIEIRNKQTNELLYKQDGCIFPEDFSQTACEIIASKYFYRAVNEHDYFDLISRMVDFWIAALVDEGLSWEKQDLDILRDELLYTLLHQMWAPNSPQWFNTGINIAYGITGDPDDMYFVKDGEIVRSKDRYTHSQTCACFITGADDQLIGGNNTITGHFVTETKLFKGGSGVGSNFSSIRAKGAPLSSGGTASGVMSFLKGLDCNAGTIKSGGTTRRAAKMVILDATHPEVNDFIDWKVKEEEKAKALIAAGYDPKEAYATVSGQNSNNTVRVFEHERELLKKMANSAWACGDPGIQFGKTVNKWNTIPKAGEIRSSNPCGEFLFIDDSACNLASINLAKFWEGKQFDLESFIHLVWDIQLVLDASIHWGQFPTPEIAYNSYLYRPTGLGITNLAELFRQIGIQYSSKEARDLSGTICGIMTLESYRASDWMKRNLEPVDNFLDKSIIEDNQEAFDHVISQHREKTRDAYHRSKKSLGNIFKLPEGFKESFWQYYPLNPRNAQVTCIAPTGTISFAMDCKSTGIEPFFSREITKICSDGSVITETVDSNVETAHEISAKDQMKLMAAIQPVISGGISKTINLPESATPDDIVDIYELAYSLGLKSITVYRDNSKASQVLYSKSKEDPVSFKANERRKPDAIHNSQTHSLKIGDVELYITAGFYNDGSLAEIFVNTDRDGSTIQGLLSTISKLISHLLQRGVEPKEISKVMRGVKFEPNGLVTRHDYIKFADSIPDLISKVIDIVTGDYTYSQVKPEEYKSDEKEIVKLYDEVCPNCGSTDLIKSGTCKTCTRCGSTTGCS